MTSFKLKSPAGLHYSSKVVYRSYNKDGEKEEVQLTLSKKGLCEDEELLELLNITENNKPIEITLNLQPHKDNLDYLEKISE